ncbi:metallophosphoesterase [Clostridium sp. LP20]|uniref:metallophosphoesterase n=1 Tax=Clostridium sp. LP20 TaxID=3418665 RepID=UPI003EE6933C
MKKLKLIILFCFILLFFGCGKKVSDKVESKEVLSKGNSIKLIVATDIHYISPDIIDEGTAFQNMYKNGDGKEVHYIDKITDAFIDEVIEKKPNALILSGDLTLNGEKVSHEVLAKKLQKVKDNRIPVLVIPGNHDINNYNARGYKSDTTYTVESITPEEFREIYGDFGYSTEVKYDKNSLSYVAEISDDLWLIMIDTNKYTDNNRWLNPSEASGKIKKDTYRWLQKSLDEAKSKGVTPITVMHHNLVNHNKIINKGYTIDNSQEVINLLKKYDVKLNLSGHIHAQNITNDKISDKKVYDIATSSLSVYTNQYGIIEFLPNKSISYNTKAIEIEEWAKKNNIPDKNLLNHQEYSNEFFRKVTYGRTIRSLNKLELTDKEKSLMASVVSDLNPHYFSGTVNSIYKNILASEGFKLWLDNRNNSLGNYIYSIMEDTIKDENSITIPLIE